MALKPSDLKSRTNASVTARADIIEKMIDKSLQDNLDFVGSATCYIDGTTPALVQEEVRRRFKEAGWHSVEFKSSYDQRAGDAHWVELKS